MAFQVATVSGKIVSGNGVGVAGGRLVFRLSQQSATADDGGVQQQVTPHAEAYIDSDGTVGKRVAGAFVATFDLVANSVITPAGTSWLVEILPDNLPGWRESWSTVPGPIEIGNITRN